MVSVFAVPFSLVSGFSGSRMNLGIETLGNTRVRLGGVDVGCMGRRALVVVVLGFGLEGPG